jgi:hypothetical protein
MSPDEQTESAQRLPVDVSGELELYRCDAGFTASVAQTGRTKQISVESL